MRSVRKPGLKSAKLCLKGERKIPAGSTDTAGCSRPGAVKAEVEMMEKSDLSHLPEGAEFWIIVKNKTCSASGLSQNHLGAPSQSHEASATLSSPTWRGCSGSLEYLGASPGPRGSNQRPGGAWQHPCPRPCCTRVASFVFHKER